MIEIWKDIKGYEGLYQISNLGRVKSLNYHRTGRDEILKLTKNKGYLCVNLYKNGKLNNYKVHRLVAEAFIPNPNNYPQVNHKDEDKTNNCVYINEDGTVDLEKSNLEFCTNEYNANYGTRNKRLSENHKGVLLSKEHKKKLSESRFKPVLQIDKNTNNVITEFPSLSEINRQFGYSQGHISKCCNGKRKTAYGFIWRYKESAA